MKKKILEIAVILMAVAMLAVPVYAKPTKGNKVAVTLILSNMTYETVEVVETGPVAHTYFPCQHYDVIITLDDHPEIDPLVGTVDVERKFVEVPQPNKGYDPPAGDQKWITTDYYVFDFGEGGFEGNGKVIIDGATAFVVAPWEKSRSNYLFHGTGEFEGQTLNFNHPWNPFGGGVPGTPGYWLKYELPTP